MTESFDRNPMKEGHEEVGVEVGSVFVGRPESTWF